MFLISPVWLGDKDSYRRNQASQLSVSALGSEHTGVISSKKHSREYVLTRVKHGSDI